MITSGGCHPLELFPSFPLRGVPGMTAPSGAPLFAFPAAAGGFRPDSLWPAVAHRIQQGTRMTDGYDRKETSWESKIICFAQKVGVRRGATILTITPPGTI